MSNENHVSSTQPRGISNPTGTACHLSSALVILHYCLEPIRMGIIETARRHDCPDDLMHHLGCLLRELLFDSRGAVDPSLCYQSVGQVLGVEPCELGDAVTALIKLLQHLRLTTLQSNANQETGIDSMWKFIWNEWIDSGRVHSVLDGIEVSLDNNNSQPLHFSKKTKVRQMAVPYSVSAQNVATETTLVDLLQNSIMPQEIQGYQWPDSSCQTTKTLHLDTIPPIWMIHIDRFVWKQNVKALDATIQIPLELAVDEFLSCHDTETRYQLMGGILHVNNDNVEEEEEGGHYVSVVRYNNEWYLMDDEETTRLDVQDVLRLLSGSFHTVTQTYMRGILVVYHAMGDSRQQELRAILHDKLASTDMSVDWTRPEALVGRRLQVQWAKSKYYAGVVSSYSPATGKHEIVYDDGDVRSYILRKKTLQWET